MIHSTRRVRGVVLVELLVAIATIAFITAVVLTALQKTRESANQSSAQKTLRLFGVGAIVYEADFGRFPRGVAPGTDFWDEQAEKLGLEFSPTGDTLLGSGYEFSYSSDGEFFEMVATPVAPGLTASLTQAIDDQSITIERDEIIVTVRETPTPGAEENREAALAAIRECGKATVAQLLGSEGTREEARLVKCFVQDEAKQVFHDLDSDNDGVLTFVEILGEKNEQLSRELRACIALQLQLGAGGERVGQLPGVSPEDLSGNPADLFSFAEVCASTILASAKAGVARAACQKLEAAEKAERRGKLKVRDNVLKAYQSLVAAQRGKAFSADDAAVLIVLAEVLKAEAK